MGDGAMPGASFGVFMLLFTFKVGWPDAIRLREEGEKGLLPSNKGDIPEELPGDGSAAGMAEIELHDGETAE
jgi:hypothetical protein